jgi:hypothetical protein
MADSEPRSVIEHAPPAAIEVERLSSERPNQVNQFIYSFPSILQCRNGNKTQKTKTQTATSYVITRITPSTALTTRPVEPCRRRL